MVISDFLKKHFKNLTFKDKLQSIKMSEKLCLQSTDKTLIQFMSLVLYFPSLAAASHSIDLLHSPLNEDQVHYVVGHRLPHILRLQNCPYCKIVLYCTALISSPSIPHLSAKFHPVFMFLKHQRNQRRTLISRHCHHLFVGSKWQWLAVSTHWCLTCWLLPCRNPKSNIANSKIAP